MGVRGAGEKRHVSCVELGKGGFGYAVRREEKASDMQSVGKRRLRICVE